MEEIIGASAWNDHIQNYEAGGEWAGEGRGFRYPLRFPSTTTWPGSSIVQAPKFVRRHQVDDEIPDEVFFDGYYAFGANTLHIFRVLDRMLVMLVNEYGLKIEQSKSAPSSD
jgi:hypothetical protein